MKSYSVEIPIKMVSNIHCLVNNFSCLKLYTFTYSKEEI